MALSGFPAEAGSRHFALGSIGATQMPSPWKVRVTNAAGQEWIADGNRGSGSVGLTRTPTGVVAGSITGTMEPAGSFPRLHVTFGFACTPASD